MKFIIFKYVIFILAAFALSCSRSEPKIEYGYMELVYYPGEERPEERFTFFVIPQDDDGIENLGDLFLFHDGEGLKWTLTSGDWVRIEDNGRTWIGSKSIAASPGEGSLPRGQYRAVLVNKGGEKTERAFTFDAPLDAEYPYPAISVEDGRYAAQSQYPVNRLLCYDQKGAYLQTVELPALEGSIADLKLSNNARTAALWAEDPEYRTSAVTESVNLR